MATSHCAKMTILALSERITQALCPRTATARAAPLTKRQRPLPLRARMPWLEKIGVLLCRTFSFRHCGEPLSVFIDIDFAVGQTSFQNLFR
jgi:hypothetical protein